jgi:HSP20 family protein
MLANKYEPFNDIRRGFDLVNTLMNTVATYDESQTLVDFSPKVNTRENEKAYYIEVELAGMKKEEVDVQVDDNILIISGNKTVRNGLSEEDYQKLEGSYGFFSRSFTLPENIDLRKIVAKSENGVLEVIVPKVEIVEKESTKIKVQ